MVTPLLNFLSKCEDIPIDSIPESDPDFTLLHWEFNVLLLLNLDLVWISQDALPSSFANILISVNLLMFQSETGICMRL